MKTFDRKDFLEKVKVLYSIAEFTPNEVALLVFSEGNKLLARGKNIHIEADFEHNLNDISVSIERIKNLFEKFNSEVKLKVKDNILEIKSGKFKSKLPLIQQEEDYKIISQKRFTGQDQLPGNIIEAIKVCQISVSKQKSFNWVLDNFGLIEDRLITTDSQRCTVYHLDWPLQKDFSVNKEVARLLTEIDIDYYNVSENYIEFKSDDFYIRASKNQEAYPEIDKDIFNSNSSFKVDLKDFINAVEKIKIFSEQLEGNANSIQLEVNDNDLIVYSQNEFGYGKEKLSIKSKSKADIRINPYFLLDILKVLKQEEIKVRFSDKVVIFEEEDFKHVIALVSE